MSLDPLPPSCSRNEITQIVMPVHVNGTGSMMFGGTVVQWIDVCAGVAAMRHAGGAVVTASIDRLDFMNPIRLGEVVVLQAQVNFASRTSMEVGVRVETEPWNKAGTEPVHVASAYLVFVAIDLDGRPREVPGLVPETPDEIRRVREAEIRRAHRLAAKREILEGRTGR